jgi:hypothetical protein
LRKAEKITQRQDGSEQRRRRSLSSNWADEGLEKHFKVKFLWLRQKLTSELPSRAVMGWNIKVD